MMDTNPPIDATPPDFSAWNTNRIKFLLAEYKGTLPAMRTLYGQKAEEAETLRVWIEAMERELLKRSPKE